MDIEITTNELKSLIDNKKSPVLLDVREEMEYELVKIDGSLLIPLGELQLRLDEISKDDHIVTYCHHGRRSLMAANILLGAGFTKVQSLAGGINSWAEDIEPTMKRY